METRDGRWVLLRTAPTPPETPDIFGLRMGDSIPGPLIVSPASDMFPQVSPDGRWLAYASDESGRFEVYVRPFPETATAKWQVSTGGGTEPEWSSTGRELVYMSTKGDMVSVEIPPGSTFSVGRQRVLFSAAQLLRGGPVPSYWLSPDDKRFLMLREGESGQPGELIVAENWLPQLRSAGR